MKVSDPGTTQNLTLDKPFVNPRLARRLPPITAFRYHALPVAKDDGCITVAMADPDDAVARAEVAAALGSRRYVVQTDPKAIDGLLAEVWPEESRHCLRLLVYHQASPIAGEVQAYARSLSDLVWGHLGDFQTVAPAGATLDDLTEAACGYDLVVFGEPDQSLLERLRSGPADLKASELVPTSVLIARQPRRPLRQMLLVTRGHKTDDVAVDWIIRLGQPSNAAVTVLGVEPDMPALCRIIERLVNWGIEGTFFHS